MAKHQVALVGGQILPVYFGAIEFQPDFIHLIVTTQSSNKTAALKGLLGSIKTKEYACDPYNISSVKNICDKIILSMKEADEITFNLTGGSKVMLLGAQLTMNANRLTGFYINQNEQILSLPDLSENKLTCTVSTVDFLKLSGHEFSSCKPLDDIPATDISAARKIDDFADNYKNIYKKLHPKIKKTYEDFNKIPIASTLEINSDTKVTWTEKNISINHSGRNILSITAPHARELFFRASWWELIVADRIKKWPRIKEILIQCELPFRGDKTITKNEIDILINVGRRMIFVECKSGRVSQDDINKMRIIKDTYGGFIAKSMLVCRYPQVLGIVEKCRELDICLLILTPNMPNNTALSALDKLNKKLNI